MRHGPGILGRWLAPTHVVAGCRRGAVVVLLLATLCGCSTPPPLREAAASADAQPFTFSPDRRADVFTAVAAALRDAGYAIDRADYRTGVVTTAPRPVATVFEPWGGLAQTSEDTDLAWAATLGRLRRVVRVTAEPMPDAPGSERLRVAVQLERYAAPTRRVINASRQRMFSALSAVPDPWGRRGITAVYWHPIGRDVQEEAKLSAAMAPAPPTP